MLKKGILLDVEYTNKGNSSVIQLFLKTGESIELFEYSGFSPYFYIVLQEGKMHVIDELKAMKFGEEGISIKELTPVEKKGEENAVKLVCNNVKDLLLLRQEIKAFPEVKERREYDIPFTKRFLIDFQLKPMSMVEVDYNDNKETGIKEVKAIKEVDENPKDKLRIACFDLETYSPGRFSDPEKDPIIMVSYVNNFGKKLILTTKDECKVEDYVKVFPGEGEMIKFLIDTIKEDKLDVIVTYNGDSFDFPYLRERAKLFGVKIDINSDGSEPSFQRKGQNNTFKLKGIQHIDAYQVLRILSRFAIVNLIKFDLESVLQQLYSIEKEKITAERINQIWDSCKGLEKLINYNLEDSVYTLKITENYLPLIIELSKLVKQSMFDVSRASASILVENLLISKSFLSNKLIPNKPREEAVKQRMLQSFEGGYVKEPKSGLHEDIAVLDFRSLYPTIMISHNISSDTLRCGHEKCKSNADPEQHVHFCLEKKGFLSSILEEILNRRIAIKKEIKEFEKESDDYRVRHARQQALKILLNSFYGTLAYARFRWYSREAARAVTAWSRYYVNEISRKAEDVGFISLYSDTDSAFLKLTEGKTKEDVLKFADEINKDLPGVMELEFEGLFKRGIFVTKKEGGAAKKRYALIDFNDNLKIVGFEYVRRDWANTAKETQRKVIELVLKEGKPEKAVEFVRKVIEDLKSGKVLKKDLTVLTQIKRQLSSYEAIGPHVAAAKKAIARGKELGVGSVIGYIITKAGKSISDRAELEEYVQEGNYDAEYYIKNQVLPAVIKILRELGYSEQDLIHGGKQKTLGEFF